MHLNGTEIGWLLSAFSLAYGFAQLPLIGLLDRAGTRSILGGGLILFKRLRRKDALDAADDGASLRVTPTS